MSVIDSIGKVIREVRDDLQDQIAAEHDDRKKSERQTVARLYKTIEVLDGSLGRALSSFDKRIDEKTKSLANEAEVAQLQRKLAKVKDSLSHELAVLSSLAQGTKEELEQTLSSADALASSVKKQIDDLVEGEISLRLWKEKTDQRLSDLSPELEEFKTKLNEEVGGLLEGETELWDQRHQEIRRQLAEIPGEMLAALKRSQDDLIKLADADRAKQITEEISARLKEMAPALKGDAGPEGRMKRVGLWYPKAVHKEGSLCVHEGTTWQARRDTDEEPGPKCRDWFAVAVGVKSAEITSKDNVLRVSLELGNGASFDHEITLPKIRYFKTWSSKKEYRAQDSVMCDGHRWLALNDTQEKPGASEDWICIGMRGQRGKPGEPAPPVQVPTVEKVFTAFMDYLQGRDGAPVQSYRGNWKYGEQYEPGDLVNFQEALFCCFEANPGEITPTTPQQSSWAMMLDASSGGGGGGGSSTHASLPDLNTSGHPGSVINIPGGVSGNAVAIDASGNLVDSGTPPGGSGTTNLTNTPSATEVTIHSSSGQDTSVAGATGSLAGVITAADKAKLDGIAAGAEVNTINAGDNVTLLANNAGYIPATGVTYANLDANGDVGPGATQVAKGDHGHTSSQISDFDTAVSNNPSVTANTAKVSASGSIDTHSDVDITTDAPQEGEVLVWRTDTFVPEPAPGGGNWVNGQVVTWNINDSQPTKGTGAGTYAVTDGQTIVIQQSVSGTINITGSVTGDETISATVEYTPSSGATPTFQINGSPPTKITDPLPSWRDNSTYFIHVYMRVGRTLLEIGGEMV